MSIRPASEISDEHRNVKNDIDIPNIVNYVKKSTLKTNMAYKSSKCPENLFCVNLYESFGKDVPNASNLIVVFFAKS